MVVSTYNSYLTINRDMKASLSKVEIQASVKRDTEYYEANIGKVKTVDDLHGDYRLYSYAMKAYGPRGDDLWQGFHAQSAGKRSQRQQEFCQYTDRQALSSVCPAFNFKGDTKVAQNTAQADSTTEAYKASFTAEETNIKTESAYSPRASLL